MEVKWQESTQQALPADVHSACGGHYLQSEVNPSKYSLCQSQVLPSSSFTLQLLSLSTSVVMWAYPIKCLLLALCLLLSLPSQVHNIYFCCMVYWYRKWFLTAITQNSLKKPHSVGLFLFIVSPVETREAAVTRNPLYKTMCPIYLGPGQDIYSYFGYCQKQIIKHQGG